MATVKADRRFNHCARFYGMGRRHGLGARLAGRHAARALREGDTSAANLQAYHEEWMALLGRDHVWYYKMKDALNRMPDESLDKLARTVNGIPIEKRTLGRIFAHALIRNPSLLPAAARFFAPARREESVDAPA